MDSKCVAGPAAKDRIAGPLSLVQQDSESMKGVQQALDLNLVRALMLMSGNKEAVERFGTLEASGGVPLYMSPCPPPCDQLACWRHQILAWSHLHVLQQSLACQRTHEAQLLTLSPAILAKKGQCSNQWNLCSTANEEICRGCRHYNYCYTMQTVFAFRHCVLYWCARQH